MAKESSFEPQSFLLKVQQQQNRHQIPNAFQKSQKIEKRAFSNLENPEQIDIKDRISKMNQTFNNYDQKINYQFYNNDLYKKK